MNGGETRDISIGGERRNALPNIACHNTTFFQPINRHLVSFGPKYPVQSQRLNLHSPVVVIVVIVNRSYPRRRRRRPHHNRRHRRRRSSNFRVTVNEMQIDHLKRRPFFLPRGRRKSTPNGALLQLHGQLSSTR